MTDSSRVIRKEGKKRYGFGVERMQEIKVCAYCGTVAEEIRIFCPECSKMLPRETVYRQYQKRPRTCRLCGHVVTDKMQFCPDCGEKLDQ